MKMNEIQIARILDQAQKCVAEERQLRAIQIYRRLINAEPDVLQGYLELSDLYVDIRMEAAAIGLLRDAREKFGDALEILVRLGELYRQREEYNEMIGCFSPLIGVPFAHFNLGLANRALGNLEVASHHFYESLRLDQYFPKACESIAEILIVREEYQESIKILHRAIRISPYSAVAHYLLGVAYFSLRKFAAAFEEYILAVDMDPHEAGYWRSCASCLIELDRPEEAAAYNSKSLELSPNSVEVRVLLSRLDGKQASSSSGERPGSVSPRQSSRTNQSPQR